MRIGLVCPYDMSAPGGVQAQVRGLAASLTGEGHDVTVMAPGLQGGDHNVDLGASVSVPGNGSMAPISVNPLVRRLIGKAARDCDVLHVHEPLMPTVSLAALRVGRPVVATFHAAPGRLAAALYRSAGPAIEVLLGNEVQVVTAVSGTAAVNLPDSLAARIIPNGVDVAFFSERPAQRVEKRVCFLGRDERRKGLDVLLAAWRGVADQIPDAELVVMGAARDDIQEGVEYMGYVDEETKAEMLSSSAIYVAPNLGGESFGIVLAEAMAAGAGVVASDLASFRAVAGDAAEYFQIADTTALAEMLTRLLTDDSRLARMSIAGRGRVSEFDWSAVTRSYISAYEDAIS